MSATPLPQPAPSATPVFSSRTRARLRFWATFLFVLFLVGGASAAIYRYRQSLPSPFSRPLPRARAISSSSSAAAANSRRTLRPDLRPPRPQPPHRVDGASGEARQGRRTHRPLRFLHRPAAAACRRKPPSARPGHARSGPRTGQNHLGAGQDRTRRRRLHRRARPPRSLQTGNRQPHCRAKPATIDLGVAEQKLKVQEATVDLHATSDRSRIASLTRARDQAAADVDLTKSRIAPDGTQVAHRRLPHLPIRTTRRAG